ncbi:MAG: hypothetical protein U1E32_05265 [Rhodoglobus sp.]|nr:hypothetical protein [Rhodoglobus sp.]
MQLTCGQPIHRDRRAMVADPMNPSRQVEGDFDPELTITLTAEDLTGAAVMPSSSVAPLDATRSQILTQESLYLSDPTADVRPRDRIRVGGTAEDFTSGTPYIVEVVPAAPMNPFTGWQPVKEVPLQNKIG